MLRSSNTTLSPPHLLQTLVSAIIGLVLASPTLSAAPADHLPSGTPAIGQPTSASAGQSAASSPALLPRTPSGFPARPVRILVPTSPGGLIDLTARRFAELATRHSSTPFIVINKPGGGGVVSFEETLRSPADGYTLQAATRSNVAKLVAANRSDLLGRIHWLARLLDDPQCVIVKRHGPTPDWPSVLAQASALGGRQLWLGPDIGGLDHISAARVWEAAGFQARWIPYESGGQALAALMGGHGSTYTGNPGEVRGRPDLAIAAVCAPERLPQFPDAPTFRELGIPGLENETMWRGIAIHPSTPPEILAWHQALLERIASDPAWQAEWQSEGLSVKLESHPAFTTRISRETAEFTSFLRQLGILPEPGIPLPRPSPWLWATVSITALLLASIAVVLALRKAHPLHWSPSFFAALCGMAAAGILAFAVGTLPAGNRLDPIGPGGIPLLWAALLVVCFAAVARQSLPSPATSRLPIHPRHSVGQTSSASPSNSEASPVPAPDSPIPPPLPGFVLAWALALLLTSIPLLMSGLGYYLTVALAFPAALCLLGWQKPLSISAITLGWLLFAWLIFAGLLHVDLPGGLPSLLFTSR